VTPYLNLRDLPLYYRQLPFQGAAVGGGRETHLRGGYFTASKRIFTIINSSA
jgi:hypothetical protein